MPAALWLVALPIGVAPVVYILRKSMAGALLAAVIAFFATWLTVRMPTDAVMNVLGRTVELDSLSQVTLAVLFAATATLFLTLAFHKGARRSESLRHEARIFYPAALVILALFGAAGLSRHLGIAAIFIELAAILAVFVIQTERLESTRAALRFLVLFSLATPLFLLAAWQIDVYQLGGGSITKAQLERTALFVSLGFAIWLAVVPFHSWLTSTAIEATPPMAAFVLTTFPVVAFSAFIHLLIDLPWLVDSSFLVSAMIVAGVFTAFAGGVMAAVQRGFSELLGYSALFNLGYILVVLGIGGRAAIVTILASLMVRSMALVLIAASTSALHARITSDGFSDVRGMAWQMPVATAGLIVGGLTLAGMPLTAGFPPYWQLLSSMAQVDARGLILVVLGGVGVATGYLRGFRATLAPVSRAGLRLRWQEPWPLLVIITILGLLCLLLGFFPSLLIEPLQATITGISFPIRN
jgi:multicomponent Na+:H+ antiporter subunit D